MENPPRQASLTINWYWTQTLLGPNLAGCYMPGFSLGRWATQPRACSQPISWSTPLGSGIPSSRAILPCGAARGRLRTSRTSAGLSGSACRERSAGMGQRQPHNRAGRCGAVRADCGADRSRGGGPGAVPGRCGQVAVWHGRVPGRGSGPVHIRATLGGRGRGARGRVGGVRGRRRSQSAPRSHRCKQEHNGASGGRAAAKLGASAARLTGRPANGRWRVAPDSQWARCGGGPGRG